MQRTKYYPIVPGFGQIHREGQKDRKYSWTNVDYEGVMGVVQNCPIYFLKHLECFYQGQWLDCLPHGSGIAVYKNHSYYEG